MYPAILFMILVAFAVFCLINAKRIIWNFEKSSLGRPLSETPPLKWRILLALLFLIASAFMAFTAYILLGDTLLGGAPCVVAIGMGHELRNFRAKGVCRRRNPRLLPPPQGRDHPRKHASTPLKTSTRPCSHHPSHPQPATQPASSEELSAIRLLYGMYLTGWLRPSLAPRPHPWAGAPPCANHHAIIIQLTRGNI